MSVAHHTSLARHSIAVRNGPGVACDEADQAPAPIAFDARTCTSYCAPLSSPVTVWLVAAPAGLARFASGQSAAALFFQRSA